jgi:hypothetical protein
VGVRGILCHLPRVTRSPCRSASFSGA